MTTTLKVSEQFYSLQGEGKTMGMPSNFLRLGNCNLLCKSPTWVCDTIEVWRKSVATSWPDIVDKLSTKCDRLIVTGGEPLLQQPGLADFLEFLKRDTWIKFIEVETNGTITPNLKMTDHVNQWNVSPKLSTSGTRHVHRYKPEALRYLVPRNSQFKFVVNTKEDLHEIGADFDFIPHEKIWLMPGADNREDLQRVGEQVIQWAIELGYNYSNRLHIQVWNKKTGV